MISAVTLSAEPGTDITRTASLACAFVKDHRGKFSAIQLNFNDTLVHVYADDTPGTLEARWKADRANNNSLPAMERRLKDLTRTSDNLRNNIATQRRIRLTKTLSALRSNGILLEETQLEDLCALPGVAQAIDKALERALIAESYSGCRAPTEFVTSGTEPQDDPSASPEAIARVAHEVNRAYCAAIGDDSQVSWEEAPDWQRDSALQGVQAHLSTPLTPEQSHENWLAVKEAEGWVYGAIKDPVSRTHPAILPYAELPPEQKVKDYLFAAVVSVLSHA